MSVLAGFTRWLKDIPLTIFVCLFFVRFFFFIFSIICYQSDLLLIPLQSSFVILFSLIYTSKSYKEKQDHGSKYLVDVIRTYIFTYVSTYLHFYAHARICVSSIELTERRAREAGFILRSEFIASFEQSLLRM